MEEHLFAVYKHFRFLGNGGVSLKDTEHHVGRHGRAYHFQRGRTKTWQPSERGGYTLCFIYNDEGEVVATGVAECSKLDHFCYRLGREISRGRALKTLRPEPEDSPYFEVGGLVA